MPPLDAQQEPIQNPAHSPLARPVHPSPAISLLGLERFTPKEVGWWGHRFGIDTPYIAVPLGWGEDAPLYGVDALEGDPDAFVLPPE